MKVSSSWIYARDIANLISWLEYADWKQGKIMTTDEMDFNSIFTFGKRKGDMLKDVIHDDPSYIEWLVENDVVPFAPGVMNYLDREKII